MALIHITYRCDETCSHCLVNAGPQHPEGISRVNFLEILNRIAKLLTNHEPLVISGGEPTLHPQWNSLLEDACKRFSGPVFFLSNGLWILNERRDVVSQEWRKLRRRFGEQLMGQIRTHPKYYPSYDRLWPQRSDLEALGFIVKDDEIRISPLGRAKAMTPEMTYPSCVNYRLALKQRRFLGLGDLLRCVRKTSHMDLCKPLVDDRGMLYLGESNCCQPIGSVLHESEEILLKNALATLDGCRNCGLTLDRNYREFLRAKGL